MDVKKTAKSIYACGVLQSDVLSRLENNGADVFAVIDSCFLGQTADGDSIADGLQPLIAT